MAVQRPGREGGDIFRVEREDGACAGANQIALVEAQSDLAAHGALCARKEGLQGFAERCEPLAGIEERGILFAERASGGKGIAVEHQGFQAPLCLEQNCDAGNLVNAARLHADDAVFDDVKDADAVLAADFVQLAEQIGELHALAVKAHRHAFLKADAKQGLGVGRLLRRDAEPEKFLKHGLLRGIFEFQTLVGAVPEVSVVRIGMARVKGKVNAFLATVGELVLAGAEGPEFRHAPGCDDLEFGGESFHAQLKANLVVALSRRTVANRNGVFLSCQFHEFLGYQRAGQRIAEQGSLFGVESGLQTG